MEGWRHFRRLAWLALGWAMVTSGGVMSVQGQVSAASTVVRTLVYHQITSVTNIPDANGGAPPVLSASGNRAAFLRMTDDPIRMAHINVINADSGEPQEVDAYPPITGGISDLDISADGSKVVSTDAVQLRIANAAGGGARTLIALDGDPINSIRISGDGTKVFFRVYGDTTIRGTSKLVPRGVWVIDAAGGVPQQIVGAKDMAAVLGIPVSDVPLFGSGGNGLDVSTDGSRIVFGQRVPVSGGGADGLFGVNLDGTRLHQYLEPAAAVYSPAISGDGTKVGYHISPLPCCSSPDEVGVLNFDGTGRRVLLSGGTRLPVALGDSRDRLQLSADGSRLLFGSTGVLFDTTTGSATEPPKALQLAARGGYYSGDPGPLAGDGMFRATMNDSATRFLYIARDEKGVLQLATLDLNPSSLGAAPSITNTTIDPPFVLTQARSAATISAQVNTIGTLGRVGGVVLRNGLSSESWGDAPVLLDNGITGDARAGDGIFTSNRLLVSGSVVGPRTVRIKAEARGSDGKRHATAVDIEPFEVRGDTPPPTTSPSTTPTPTPTPTPAPASMGRINLSLSLSADRIKGGTAVTGTVSLSRPAPAGGVQLILASDTPDVASVPDTLAVPAGATATTFTISTHPVSAAAHVEIAVDFADLNSAIAGDFDFADLLVTP